MAWNLFENLKILKINIPNGCKQDILYILITFFKFENMKKTKFQTSNLPLAF
jgi:hypothetical protein